MICKVLPPSVAFPQFKILTDSMREKEFFQNGYTLSVLSNSFYTSEDLLVVVGAAVVWAAVVTAAAVV